MQPLFNFSLGVPPDNPLSSVTYGGQGYNVEPFHSLREVQRFPWTGGSAQHIQSPLSEGMREQRKSKTAGRGQKKAKQNKIKPTK